MTPQQRDECINKLKQFGWITSIHDIKTNSMIYAPTLNGEAYCIELAKLAGDHNAFELLDMDCQNYFDETSITSKLESYGLVTKYYDHKTHKEQTGLTKLGFELFSVMIWLVNPTKQKGYQRMLKFKSGMQKGFTQLDGVMRQISGIASSMSKIAPENNKFDERRHIGKQHSSRQYSSRQYTSRQHSSRPKRRSDRWWEL